MYLIGWLSLRCLVVFFLELCSVLTYGPFVVVVVVVLVRLLHIRGGALGVHQGGVRLLAAL